MPRDDIPSIASATHVIVKDPQVHAVGMHTAHDTCRGVNLIVIFSRGCFVQETLLDVGDQIPLNEDLIRGRDVEAILDVRVYGVINKSDSVGIVNLDSHSLTMVQGTICDV
jgi:hypothetical protein